MKPTDLALVQKTIEHQATLAAEAYLKNVLGGEDWIPCGFAWVTCTPEHKGNTKLGRQERAVLKAIGFEQSYDRTWQLWMPGRIQAQNMHIHEAGAKEAAKVIRNTVFFVNGIVHNFQVHVQTRMD